jgi:P4 family phage/plasmid primase-like protien
VSLYDNDQLIVGENYYDTGADVLAPAGEAVPADDAPEAEAATPKFKGATAAEWYQFTDELDLRAHVLPCVPADPNTKISEFSALKQLGKTPSDFNSRGEARGIRDWTKREITEAETNMWSNDRRLNMCIRTGISGVHAIDVDIDDVNVSAGIEQILNVAFKPLGYVNPSIRRRPDTGKFLLPLVLEGPPCKKAIIRTEHGIIELLGDGQQFVAAGSHASGKRYQWTPKLPDALPLISREALQQIWTNLTEVCALAAGAPAAAGQIESAGGPGSTDQDQALLTTIDVPTRKDLESALRHLCPFAGDNSVWNEIGYALLTLKAQGKALWIEFSRNAPNYEQGAPEAWWEAHLRSNTRTDYRHVFTMALERGWERSNVSSGDEFDPVPEDPNTPPEVEISVGEVPPAVFPCTDQANAGRLRRAYGRKLISVEGAFYAWNGRYWERDEGEAARCSARLSSIVCAETELLQAHYNRLASEHKDTAYLLSTTARPDQSAAYKKAVVTKEGEAMVRLSKQITALQKWGRECEMSSRQNAALESLRRMGTLDSSHLDRDPWLFNCENGTVDLRTSELRQHDPLNYITKIASVSYDPNALAPRFERFVSEIVGGDETVSSFVRRWLGYCMTGSIREQAMLILIGPGSNGKTTLLNAATDVMGDYAAPCDVSLIVGDREAHASFRADLHGRRLVTASEIEDGAPLREATVKALTGGDPITAKRLYTEPFTFAPTHKTQLLTNHKPVIRGQDYGIWRRLYLVTFPIKFGTVEDVAEGKANRVRDDSLEEALRSERAGIFAWLVRGSVEWYKTGLRAPASVRAATQDYQQEQDRIGQFVNECCVLDPKVWTPFDSLYPEYMRWCRDSGYLPLGKQRFSQELERVVPGFKRTQQKQRVDQSAGARKSVYGCHGIRLDNGFPVEQPAAETAFPVVNSSSVDKPNDATHVKHDNSDLLGDVHTARAS